MFFLCVLLERSAARNPYYQYLQCLHLCNNRVPWRLSWNVFLQLLSTMHSANKRHPTPNSSLVRCGVIASAVTKTRDNFVTFSGALQITQTVWALKYLIHHSCGFQTADATAAVTTGLLAPCYSPNKCMWCWTHMWKAVRQKICSRSCCLKSRAPILTRRTAAVLSKPKCNLPSSNEEETITA